MGEKHAIGESIAQRSRRSQRGIGIMPRDSPWIPGFWRETREEKTIGNQRPIAIQKLTKRKAARIKRRAGVRKLASNALSLSRVSRTGAPVSKKRINVRSRPPSVASVRCSLFVAGFSHGSAGVQKRINVRSRPPSVASVTSVRCFFPFSARFSHRTRRVPSSATLELG
jgi:hypothetical protein